MTGTAAIHHERGATAVEYALLIALMAAVIFSMVILFGGGVVGLFSGTQNSIESGINP